MKKGKPKEVRIWGYAMLAFGAVSTIVNEIRIYVFHHPHNLGVTLGYGAFAIIGLFGIMVSDCLIAIEDRLNSNSKDA